MGEVETYHTPVLVDAVIEQLHGRVLDGTLGGGGHTAALLAAGARVDALDQDADALTTARARLSAEEAAGTFRAFQANFAELDQVAALAGVRYDGVLLDLGVSSHQIDDATRGFSFRPGVPLDMRMRRDAEGAPERDARAVLNDADERTLADLFRQYGDEPRAARLARTIVHRRTTQAFETSDDLVNAIRGALGPRSGPSDFARLFQAVRIAVNDELTVLGAALPALRDRLLPGGRFAVIAYHSGEDRLVKHAFREWSVACTCPPLAPRCTCGAVALGTVVTRRAVTASEDEVARNPRARSARLRVWEKA
ncbi:MAG TPA: 16S rRNA (cytosine(1402)-N(4))-methyltransferase RsmH [Gemmatimonadaceae bacterium]|nr:16S rRNA (cytosine(1402)-N(4))-methyltransferase RsmH [Gemmatimonadaceae bacterium]